MHIEPGRCGSGAYAILPCSGGYRWSPTRPSAGGNAGHNGLNGTPHMRWLSSRRERVNILGGIPTHFIDLIDQKRVDPVDTSLPQKCLDRGCRCIAYGRQRCL